MWTYDESGGWFDHVPPAARGGLRVSRAGPAREPVRAPGLRRQHAARHHLDPPIHRGQLAAGRWRARRRARSLGRAFDFSRPPARAEHRRRGARSRAAAAGVRLWVIYLGYGAALVLSAVLIGWAALRRTAGGDRALLAAMRGSSGRRRRPAHDPDRSAGAGHALRAGRHQLPGRRRGPGAPAARRRPRLAARADDRIAPGVRARFDRWYAGRRIAALEPLAPRRRPLRRPRRQPRRPARGHSRDAQRQQRPPPRVRGRRSRAGCRATGSSPRAAGRKSTRRVLRGRRGARRRARTSCTAASSASSPRESRAARSCGCCCSRRASTVRDALLGFPIGSAVRLEYPERQGRAREALGPGGELTLESLPRGDYRVSVDALGISSSRPVALSRDQEVQLQVISWLDVAVVLLGSRVARPGAAVHPPPRSEPRRRCRRRLVLHGRVAAAPAAARRAAPTRCSPTTTSGSTPAPGIAPRSTTRCSAATRATTAA